MSKISKQFKEGYFERLFFCPGCCQVHGFRTKEWPEPPGLTDEEKELFKNKWTWNGDEEHPTLHPSIHVKDETGTQCHCFVNNGFIQFLRDCKHRYKGKTMELPDW